MITVPLSLHFSLYKCLFFMYDVVPKMSTMTGDENYGG